MTGLHYIELSCRVTSQKMKMIVYRRIQESLYGNWRCIVDKHRIVID